MKKYLAVKEDLKHEILPENIRSVNDDHDVDARDNYLGQDDDHDVGTLDNYLGQEDRIEKDADVVLLSEHVGPSFTFIEPDIEVVIRKLIGNSFRR